MDSTLGKRKHSTMHSDQGFVSSDSTGSLQLPLSSRGQGHYSSENPCNINATSSSFSGSTQRPKLTSNSNSLSSFNNSSDGKYIATGVVTGGTGFSSFKQPSCKGPFSVETPYLNKETPLILATARQTGSSITASCNTDSIRQLQNPYTDRVTSSRTSEYFQRTPSSRTLPGPQSRSVTSTLATSSGLDTGEEEDDDLSNTDVRHVRQIENSSLSSNESQVCN
ncbi:uncharacterized protein LOC132747575 [Ruditapes philippinarum]|uniref:uncharacterized protein LOC132747575 n=1 Tax=Ruditapes philippinarum TaxID=129788 RepID=UPI00295A64DF|nr:uncharacterized protein LOC132747575 [Ruditapes philippinarum]